MLDEINGGCLRFQKSFMKKSAAPKTVRKPRCDAQRNRERILEVAKQVFTRRGADASMDEIAKRAKRSVPLSGAAKSFDASLRYRLEIAIVSSG